MKLSVFIAGILIITNLQAQTDSVARFRKPVAAFLIGEHYRAESLGEENRLQKLQISELQLQNRLYKKIIESHKQDSIQADSLLRLEKTISSSWKSSFEVEKMDHRESKRKVKKWKLLTVVSVGLNCALLYIAIISASQ